jgi:hypothetical protein
MLGALGLKRERRKHRTGGRGAGEGGQVVSVPTGGIRPQLVDVGIVGADVHHVLSVLRLECVPH